MNINLNDDMYAVGNSSSIMHDHEWTAIVYSYDPTYGHKHS